MDRFALLIILFVLLTGCPQDDGASMPSETGVDPTTAAPDLPGESSTTQPSTGDGDGDGDGDSTAGDGDGDTTGDGDPGDGDGDTGSEAVPASLIVESNGQRIGYLMGVWDYGFLVWDDVNEVTFNVNQVTGHVLGSGSASGYYTTNDCTGQRYLPAAYASIETCGLFGLSVRQSLRGDSVSAGGFTESMNIETSSGDPEIVNALSLGTQGQCSALAIQICGSPVVTTNVIPTTFPLPITVAETLAMP
jgi:hypothetical protein